MLVPERPLRSGTSLGISKTHISYTSSWTIFCGRLAQGSVLSIFPWYFKLWHRHHINNHQVGSNWKHSAATAADWDPHILNRGFLIRFVGCIRYLQRVLPNQFQNQSGSDRSGPDNVNKRQTFKSFRHATSRTLPARSHHPQLHIRWCEGVRLCMCTYVQLVEKTKKRKSVN